MTEAICIKCGACKYGATTKCEECSFIPITDLDQAKSIVLSDHHQSEAELKDASKIISSGAEYCYSQKLIEKYLDTIGVLPVFASALVGNGASNSNEAPDNLLEQEKKNRLRVGEGLPGTQFGRYVIIGLAGEDATSFHYEAKTFPDRLVKLKFLKPQFYSDEKAVESFFKKIEDTPNYLEYGKCDDSFFGAFVVRKRKWYEGVLKHLVKRK